MLLVHINECDVMTRSRESAADDSADGSCADDDHARAHVSLQGDLTKTILEACEPVKQKV
jgi:hypothetical protein